MPRFVQKNIISRCGRGSDSKRSEAENISKIILTKRVSIEKSEVEAVKEDNIIRLNGG